MPTDNMSRTFLSFMLMYTMSIFLCLEARIIQAKGHLPEEEKNALQEIAEQLGKRDWNFDLNPCDGNQNWNTSKNPDMPLYNNSVICNCSYPKAVCHVERMFLRAQDLPGVLPRSLAKLPYLKMIDLNRNFLSGTIPPEWASLKLELLVVSSNRLSGPIPKYLGNITTLVTLSLETNRFNGTVPAELGKLTNLVNLILCANNLTGKLPVELNNLKKLKEVQLSSNNFSGKLPSFESWKNLEMLELQATGFEGPIPSNISVLKNLIELRISDLDVGASKFPPIGDMIGLQKLLLRSCNISGRIPSFLGKMPELKHLDLSFNRFEGEIPDLGFLQKLEHVYLTGNSLSGPIEDWIKDRDPQHQIDLSYNNLDENYVPSICRDTLNLFRSYGGEKAKDVAKCLNPCSKLYYSFHVNCGGSTTIIDKINYDGDEGSSGAAKFAHVKENWGTSSTGASFDVNPALRVYVANNVSVLNQTDAELYQTARQSPLSLTYYGRCLANGKYNVTLHFAEIIFRGNRSFQSLGRRLFDVYIQGERKLKDFDIEQDAGGVDKVTKKQFKAMVENGILEIRFQYTGKGTTNIPKRGIYGPLVSAISVESAFKPPNPRRKIFISAGAALLGFFLILAIISYFMWNNYIEGRISREKELRGLDLRRGFFTYRQIRAATNDFDSANKLGEGGFGSVYKGTLLDGSIIAVKQLSSKSSQGNREFVNESA